MEDVLKVLVIKSELQLCYKMNGAVVVSDYFF
jgi:hypothetical protein